MMVTQGQKSLREEEKRRNQRTEKKRGQKENWRSTVQAEKNDSEVMQLGHSSLSIANHSL